MVAPLCGEKRSLMHHLLPNSILQRKRLSKNQISGYHCEPQTLLFYLLAETMLSQKLLQLLAAAAAKARARAASSSSFILIHKSPLTTEAAAAAAQQQSNCAEKDANPCSPVKDYLQITLGLSEHQIRIIQKRDPALLRASSVERAQQVMELLRQNGISETQVTQLLLLNPVIFRCVAEKRLKPKLQVLQSLGFTGKTLGELISKGPRILPVKDLALRIRRLEAALGGRNNLLKAATKYPTVLASNLDKVDKLVEYLRRSGMRDEAIFPMLLRFPSVLGGSSERFQAAMDYLQNLGVSVNSKAFSRVFPSLCTSSGRWEDREKLIEARGFRQDEIKELIRKQGNVVALSCETLQGKLKFLTDTAGVSTDSLLTNPSLLSYSLEKRLLPRFLIFQRLAKTRSPVKLPSLATFLKMGENVFKNRYVRGHPDESVFREILGGAHREAQLV